MSNKFLLVYLLSISFVTLSFSANRTIQSGGTNTEPACNGYYRVNPTADTDFWGSNVYKGAVLYQNTATTGVWNRFTYKQGLHPWFTYPYDLDIITCTAEPVCDGNQTIDDTTDPHTCKDIVPPCPEGEHDDLSNPDLPTCVCDNGRDKVWSPDNPEVKTCPVLNCPVLYDYKTLRMQNDTYSNCFKNYPPTLFETKYISDDGYECCYAKDRDGNSTTPPPDTNGTPPPDCGTGNHLNNDGQCVEDGITPDEPMCNNGGTWNNLTQQCDAAPDASSPTDGTGGATNGDSNGTTPYYGGNNTPTDGSSGERTNLEYNNDEVNGMLNEHSSIMNNAFNEFLGEYIDDIMGFYKISIPVSPNCGCSDIPISLDLVGGHYEETIEICGSLDTLFSIMRPLLWFVFLFGMLFSYLRGGRE